MSGDDAILTAIQDLRSDVIHELQEQRRLWGEAEATLLAQGRLHRDRLDEQQKAIEEVRYELDEREREAISLRQKIVELKDKVGPLCKEMEDVKRRLGELEQLVRRDTQLLPPAPENG